MTCLPLVEAVVETVVFFGLADDKQVQPDSAIAQLEQIAFILRKLTPVEKEQFASYVSQLAKDEASANGRTSRVEFLETMVEHLGLG